MLNELILKVINIFKSKRKSDIELNDNDFTKIAGGIVEYKTKQK